MQTHEELIEWAQDKGVKLTGIMPKRLPSRGIGIVATRAIKADEIILEVPTTCLRSIDTVPRAITSKLPKDISVHGLLAADLALDAFPSPQYAAWNAVCPTPADFTSMPLLWPPSLQTLLPGPAKALLTKQQAKLTQDWAAVSAAFPELELADYRYAWLLVNTRTFYYSSTKLRRRRKEDRMILQPVADLFNHNEEGCNVAFDKAGFAVRADGAYEKGEEVRISYGRHAGDFLAVEYGFVMQPNRWDEVGLDEVVVPRLSERWRERLEEANFLGGYVLDAGTVCYRTQVAVRALCCGVKEWKGFVDGEHDGSESQREVDGLLVEMLEEFRGRGGGIIAKVDGMEDGENPQRGLLVERWRHVDKLVETTIVRLRSQRDEN